MRERWRRNWYSDVWKIVLFDSFAVFVFLSSFCFFWILTFFDFEDFEDFLILRIWDLRVFEGFRRVWWQWAKRPNERMSERHSLPFSPHKSHGTAPLTRIRSPTHFQNHYFAGSPVIINSRSFFHTHSILPLIPPFHVLPHSRWNFYGRSRPHGTPTAGPDMAIQGLPQL